MLSRRNLIKTSLAASACIAMPAIARPGRHRFDVTAPLKALEIGHARLGVCLLDTATGEMAGNRKDERFALCSTFKLAMAAACLREADKGRIPLDEILPYTEADLLPWAPVTRQHLAQGGLSIAKLAQAAVEMSDGVAANLLIKRLGGPAAVTAHFKEMGDKVTRLDRYEPDLGMVLSADTRDTTTPQAYAQLVGRILTGTLLQDDSRERLLQWLRDCKTGSARLRAGLPPSWRTGNKTGSGRSAGTTNKCNDIAITFPPGKKPIIIAAYFDSGEYTDKIEARHEAVLADVGKIAAQWALS